MSGPPSCGLHTGIEDSDMGPSLQTDETLHRARGPDGTLSGQSRSPWSPILISDMKGPCHRLLCVLPFFLGLAISHVVGASECRAGRYGEDRTESAKEKAFSWNIQQAWRSDAQGHYVYNSNRFQHLVKFYYSFYLKSATLWTPLKITCNPFCRLFVNALGFHLWFCGQTDLIMCLIIHESVLRFAR